MVAQVKPRTCKPQGKHKQFWVGGFCFTEMNEVFNLGLRELFAT